MRNKATALLRSAPLMLALLPLALLPLAGAAQDQPTVAVTFAPPDIAVTPICLPRAPDPVLLARWTGWVGPALPALDPALIPRDLRRLAEMDAARWNTTIQTALLRLQATDPKFGADDLALAQIAQHVALGDLTGLAETGQVATLLARGAANSPKIQASLAGYLTEGIGVPRDPAAGAALLVEAGYGGNADALLQLSALTLTGTAPEGWDIAPDLAVAMAFGGMVGQMDPLICDRISRVAREYASGTVVTPDHDLAQGWYRFAADLGDPVAAWNVVLYQLRSEQVVKDNAVLMTYLEKAAAGGLPYARVALARVLDVGALTDRDPARALTLYQAAAADGDRAALAYLGARSLPDPATSLAKLTALPDPPAIAFTRQAERLIATKGRWVAEPAARPLLEKAAVLQEPGAIRLLASLDFAHADTEADFYAIVDRLILALSTLGEAAPLGDLRAAFLCRAPAAPMMKEAAYWQSVSAAIGTASVDLGPTALDALIAEPAAENLISLQTQALFGRATALAELSYLLARTDAPPRRIQFWAEVTAAHPGATAAKARLLLDRARSEAERRDALVQMAQASAAGDTSATLILAELMLDDPTNQTRALALLLPLADRGNGQAMALLPRADPRSFPDLAAVFATYQARIAARGDFAALLLALPFLPPADRAETRARAIAVMDCGFADAIAFATVSSTLKDPAETRRWLAIAGLLTGSDPWQLVRLADTRLALLPDADPALAHALYEQAFALGSRTATQRLIRLNGKPGQGSYDADRAVTLFVSLVERSAPDQITALLTDMRRKDPVLLSRAERLIDLDALYQRAALNGDPIAMREHALRLRAGASTPAQIAASSDWLRQAADAGDAAAMMLLSQAYSIGLGVEPSLTLARQWLGQAADAGDAQARATLALLAPEPPRSE